MLKVLNTCLVFVKTKVFCCLSSTYSFILSVYYNNHIISEVTTVVDSLNIKNEVWKLFTVVVWFIRLLYWMPFSSFIKTNPFHVCFLYSSDMVQPLQSSYFISCIISGIQWCFRYSRNMHEPKRLNYRLLLQKSHK